MPYPVLSSATIIQLQDVTLDGTAGQRNDPPGQSGTVIPGATLLQLQQRSSWHRGTHLHCGKDEPIEECDRGRDQDRGDKENTRRE